MTLLIKNISKQYESMQVLKDVSFAVKKGEIFGVFGTSGAGKTTLMRIIAGFEKHNEGTIHHDERDVTFEDCGCRNFHFPKVSNQSYWRKIFKTNRESELADGEGQLLAFEEALRNADGVLLLDDSFCEMSRDVRLDTYEELREKVKEKNLTTVFATNDFEEIFMTCDRVAILHEGKIQQIGTPREVYESPNCAAVAKLCGRNNLIKARRITDSNSDTPEFMTITGEHLLHTAKQDLQTLGAINQDITLAIRPEYISIAFGASFPEDNLIKAIVTDIDFYGATTLIELDANGLHLEVIVLRLVGLAVGDECMVGLPPDRVLVLKD